MTVFRFGELGLKIRLAAAAGAALFAAACLGTEALSRLFPGFVLYGWVAVLLLLTALFWRVRAVDRDGSLEPRFVNALAPWYLWPPGIIWALLVPEDGPDPFGRWNVLGASWNGGALYGVFFASAAVYNLLRINLRRSLVPYRP